MFGYISVLVRPICAYWLGTNLQLTSLGHSLRIGMSRPSHACDIAEKMHLDILLCKTKTV